MRKLLLPLFVLALAACTPTSANAQSRFQYRSARPMFRPVYRMYQPRQMYYQPRLIQWNRPSNGDGLFSQLMELERRKNQWIFGDVLGFGR